MREADERFIDEGCFLIELANSENDPQLSIARARVIPGVTTRWHRLRGVTERYLILQGKGLVEVGDAPPRKVVAGDAVFISPGVRQRITNTGEDDLVFLALCTPRFTEACYEALHDD